MCGEKSKELAIHAQREERRRKYEEERALQQIELDKQRAEREALWEQQRIAREDERRQEEARRAAMQPKWGWRRANNDNGMVMNYALVRVWAGGNRFNRGYSWVLFSTDDTPLNITRRLEIVNERGGLEDNPDKKRSGFSDLAAAQHDVETVFGQMGDANREMLMGLPCAGCGNVWLVPQDNGEAAKCSSCRAEEAARQSWNEDLDDLPF